MRQCCGQMFGLGRPPFRGAVLTGDSRRSLRGVGRTDCRRIVDLCLDWN